ncbi:putative chloride channel protein [Apodospora peruviana]|uniref:Chloride channel protein n=1 Tax=Apodospora peruviana TaxID=516989 RepID=A0AAE0IKU5_9PEZI|nr:putative chloride channel protein [Apodospora peruviana]
MAQPPPSAADECSPLLHHDVSSHPPPNRPQEQQRQHSTTSHASLRVQIRGRKTHRKHNPGAYDGDIESLSSTDGTSVGLISRDERALSQQTALGERLPYNDYATIDWLHDLVKDSVRHRRLRHLHIHSPAIRKSTVRIKLATWWDAAQGWVAAFLIGIITACVAFVVDISVATVADWKEGYCSRNVFIHRAACCSEIPGQDGGSCEDWRPWAATTRGAYVVYIAFALLFGLIAGSVTMTTRANLPAVADVPSTNMKSKGKGKDDDSVDDTYVTETAVGKMMYMAAGSGIPEIKTILSGFVIPHFLGLKVLLVKAVGATFAVATGMCLGKEGPFVHISTCVGYLVANLFPKYRGNQRKLREMLSVACSSGLSVAFGAPIGGVLFSYEEISTYFPRRVMWRSFLCSLVAAAALKELNPTGTGKLVLFETKYGVDYNFVHYFIFVVLGISGGIFGGVFCYANFVWSKFFRRLPLIKNNPVLELALVVLVTALLQYPNRLIRDTGDVVMEELLVDCNKPEHQSWLCQQEAKTDGKGEYYAWLISGTFVKLLLTIITFGCKVPSGIIIPALDAGALFGRMIGQLIDSISPGIFAMVGAAAFLAGVSRMTVSLAVIMFELTGEVNFIPPFMIAILTAKWVADAISAEGVYDLSQHLLGHPFLDAEHALDKVRGLGPESDHRGTMEDLMPPESTMEEITLYTGPNYRVRKATLREKLSKLKARGLMDAGLVIVNERCICHGYLPEAELEFALEALDETCEDGDEVDLLDGMVSELIDRSPMTVTAKAPVEYAVELFGKLGLRYLIIVEEETARVVGVVIKKRLLNYLDGLH